MSSVNHIMDTNTSDSNNFMYNGSNSQGLVKQTKRQHKKDNENIVSTLTDKEFMCEICDKNFLNRFNLKRHNKAVHDEGDKYSCEKCEYKAAQKSNVKRHMASIHGSSVSLL